MSRIRKPRLREERNAHDRWPISCSKYVAFLDVMGFRSLLVERFTTQSLYTFMKGVYKEAREAERIVQRLYQTDADTITLAGIGTFPGVPLVRIAQFSDSLLIVTRRDDDKASLAIQLTAMKLFLLFLAHGVPVRGAIAKGDVTADFRRSIFFGQPIIDAYLLEEQQAWYGVAEHESCQPCEQEPDVSLEPGLATLTWPYTVPMKGDAESAIKRAALNWPMMFSSVNVMENSVAIWAPRDADKKLRKYFTNTLQFGFDMWSRFGNVAQDGQPSHWAQIFFDSRFERVTPDH